MTLRLRAGNAADAQRIADLHARSWKVTYRGLFSDAFLDGPVEQERLRLWQDRLGSWNNDRNVVLLAEMDDVLQGFASVLLDTEPDWGARLDNLHVEPAAKGRGIGRTLLQGAARWVRQSGQSGQLHLMVFERNLPARQFYDAMGGECVQRREVIVEDGTRLAELRYTWRDLDRLIPA